MTGALILDFILSHCDKNSNDTTYRALALKWLKLVLKDIQTRQESFHWRFLEVKGAAFDLTADDFDYAFATILPTTLIDTTKVIHVYEKRNDITYTFVPYERFRQLVADESQQTGTTRWYSIYANSLLLYPVPSFDAVTGTADATTAFKLRDSTATFITDGVKVGMRATDTGASLTAIITAIDSEIQLSVDTDIFVATDTYSIKEVAYIDYIKMMAVAADDAVALDVPDKYEKIVIDGVLEFAYQFDPELGSMADQHIKYEKAIERMIKENGQIIAENKKPVSHRDKYNKRYDAEGKDSPLFPIDNTNM